MPVIVPVTRPSSWTSCAWNAACSPSKTSPTSAPAPASSPSSFSKTAIVSLALSPTPKCAPLASTSFRTTQISRASPAPPNRPHCHGNLSISLPQARLSTGLTSRLPRRNFRILKPSGWVVVVWQDRRMEDTPFARAYEDLLERYGTDYKRVKDSYPETDKIRAFFDPHSFRTRDLPNHQVFDWQGLCGRLRSSSYAPTEHHANHAAMMAHLGKIFEQHHENGSVRMDYFARVYYGKLPVNTR